MMKLVARCLVLCALVACASQEFEPVSTVPEPVIEDNILDDAEAHARAAYRKLRQSGFLLQVLGGLYGDKYIANKRWGNGIDSVEEGLGMGRRALNDARRERILNPSIPSNAVVIEVRVIDPGRKYPAPTKTTPKPSNGKIRYLHEGRVLGYSIGEKDFPDLTTLQDHLSQWVRLGGIEIPPVILTATEDCIMGDLIPLLDAAVAASFTDVQFGGAFADNLE
ncbi:MAG: hypothetical protein P1V35_01120 [Planctomycetota bacterium]|nr:hypothetical protein [Planctomycetota bacterium]